MTIQSILVPLAVCLIAAAPNARAQEFEAASLKPSPPSAIGSIAWAPIIQGGPGTPTPTRLTVRNWPLPYLIYKAYDIKAYQLSGPAWLEHFNLVNSDKFDIDATIAPGTTKEQFLAMLQNLLVERFGLKLHRERKEGAIYALVLGKNGPKLKENLEPELVDAPLPASQPRGADGYNVMPPGYTGMLTKPWLPGRDSAVKFKRYSMPKFALFLSGQVDRPVVDRTGLQGNYDFLVEYYSESAAAMAEPDAGPDIYEAIQSQLGLKLAADKGMIEMLAIDHVERVPAGN